MRLAVAGKGGAGKTTIAATIARLAARSGVSVLAIDADSNPNLAIALGAQQPATALPVDIVSRRLDGPALVRPVEEILDDHAGRGPDGVLTAIMGGASHAHEGCLCSAHATVSALLDQLGDTDEMLTVLDLEASPEHFSRGTARHVDVLLLVTEPYYRSLETTRRMAQLAAELPVPETGVLANKLRTPDDEDAIRDFCDRHDLDFVAAIPWSDAIVDADRVRTPAVDHAPEQDPAIDALRGVATRLLHGRIQDDADVPMA